ncbi:MAG: hypothetical protein AB8E15_11910 [Bdellovibrionales bacterium]
MNLIKTAFLFSVYLFGWNLNAYFQYESKTKCVPCGDRFLCGSLEEKNQIKLYDENFRKTTRQHCARRTGYMYEKSKRKGVELTEEFQRHSLIMDYMKEIIVHRKGKLKQRFTKGFYLGEIRLFTQPDKKSSKKLYKKLLRSNMIIPVLSFEEYKSQNNTERPRSFYQTYIRELMTQEPYHLSDKEFGGKLYSFTLYPDEKALKWSQNLTRGVASVGSSSSGSASLGGGSGPASTAKKANSKTREGKKEGPNSKAETAEKPNREYLNRYSGFGSSKKDKSKSASSPELSSTTEIKIAKTNISNSNSGKAPSYLKYSGMASDQRDLESVRPSSRVQASKESSKSPSRSLASSLPVVPSSMSTSSSTSRSKSSINSKSRNSKSEVKTTIVKPSSGPEITQASPKTESSKGGQAIPDALPSIAEPTVEIFAAQRPMSTDLKFAKEMAATNIDSIKVDSNRGSVNAPTSTRSDFALGGDISGKGCEGFREFVVSNYSNSKICGQTKNQYSNCIQSFDGEVLKKCNDLFERDFPASDKDSLSKCITDFTKLTDEYRPAKEIDQLGGVGGEDLISLITVGSSIDKLLPEFSKKVGYAKRGKYKFSKLYCDGGISHSTKDSLRVLFQRGMKGFKNIDLDINCEKLIDENLIEIIEEQQRLRIARKNSFMYFTLAHKNLSLVGGRSPGNFVGKQRTELGSQVFEKIKSLYEDLKLYMSPTDLKRSELFKIENDFEFGAIKAFENKMYVNKCELGTRSGDQVR